MLKTKKNSLVVTLLTASVLLIVGILMICSNLIIPTQNSSQTLNLVFADDEWELEGVRGYCGDTNVNDGKDVKWEYDSATRTLTISGEGEMQWYGSYHYSSNPLRPDWDSFKGNIITVNVGTGQNDNITLIGNCAFEDFTNLENLTIANTVTTICYRAFANCGKLIDIVIPNSVTDIRHYAFIAPSYSNLGTNLTLGDGVDLDYSNDLGVAYDAFVYRRFNSVSLGSQIVCDNDYYKFDSNGRLTIKNSDCLEYVNDYSLGRISDYVISMDFGNNVTELPDSNTSLSFDSLHTLTISDNITRIGSGRFARSNLLETVVFGRNLAYIGDETFINCSSLSSINLPESLTAISYRLFSGCSSLTEIVIPATVQSIANEAFAGCYNLTSMTIKNPYITFGAGAFYAAGDDIEKLNIIVDFTLTDLNSQNVNDVNQDISDFINGIISSIYPDENAPEEERGTFEYDLVEDNYTYNGVNNIELGYRPTNIYFDRSVIGVAREAFANWINTNNINNDVQITIGCFPYSFSNHTLTVYSNNFVLSEDFLGETNEIYNVVFSDDVTKISEYAFENCTSLQTVNIGSRITSIGAYAFYGCTSLSEVHIGKNVKEIGEQAFYADTETVLHIYIEATKKDLKGNSVSSSEISQWINFASDIDTARDRNATKEEYDSAIKSLALKLNSDAYNTADNLIAQKNGMSTVEAVNFYNADIDLGLTAEQITEIANCLENNHDINDTSALQAKLIEVIGEEEAEFAEEDAEYLISLITPKNAEDEDIVIYYMDRWNNFGLDLSNEELVSNIKANLGDDEKFTALSELVGGEDNATLLNNIYAELSKANPSRDDLAMLFVDERALNNAEDYLSNNSSLSTMQMVDEYFNIANDYNISNVVDLYTALESKDEAQIKNYFAAISINSFLNSIGSSISYVEFQRGGLEYIISESYTGYNSSDWWQHGAGISTHTRPVVLHYDESLSAEVEDVFVIDDVTGWDTYNITLIEEATPETGIAFNLTVLSISLVMGIVALAVVLRKKEQY